MDQYPSSDLKLRNYSFLLFRLGWSWADLEMNGTDDKPCFGEMGYAQGSDKIPRSRRAGLRRLGNLASLQLLRPSGGCTVYALWLAKDAGIRRTAAT